MDTASYMAYDAVGLSELIKKREVSREEVVHAALERLEQVNPALNAVVRTREEAVKKELLYVDNSQPFGGVPILLKDISQAIEGEPLTAGARLLKKNVARNDSNLVAKLRQAGFIFLGHTNTPEFGLKNITEPELHGATRNPWNTTHTAGGSSGGSAASVASGIVPIAGASDGGGSIRIPASFTSLFGLKPTRGRTPVGPGVGRQWQGASIDFSLSRTVRDSAALLDLLQVIQPEAAFQTPLFEGSYLEETQKMNDKKYKVAFSTESPVGTPVSEEAKQAVRKVVHWLEEQGHEVAESSNHVDGVRLMENYYLMNNGEISSVLLSMEKRLGRAITVHDVEIVTWVLYMAGKQVTAAEFAHSLAEWDVAAAKMASLHDVYDLYVTPTNAHPAPLVGELTHNEAQKQALLKVSELNKEEQQKLVYDMFLPSLTYTPFTQLANLTGQPAMSVPTYLTSEGLPMGVQFMSPKGKEDWLFHIASELEQSDLWVGMKGNPMS